MLETLNDVGGRNKKNIPLEVAGMSLKGDQTWRQCLITTSSTSKNVVDVVLFNWKLPELTRNEPK